MNAQVVSYWDRVPTQPYYHLGAYIESLRRFAEVPVNILEGLPWRGLTTKPFALRDWLRAGKNKSDRLIVTDSFDILFAKHPHGIGDRCAEYYGDAVVFNGEKGCWPRADLAEHFPDQGTPWRYLNSGFMCGTADRILALLESMDLESVGVDRVEGGKKIEPNDQGEFQAAFVKQPVPMVVDAKCLVSQTLSACSLDEFDFSDGKVLNKATGTYPGCLHTNGSAKELIGPTIRKTLNL